MISKSSLASNLPRNLQGVFLGSKINDLPIFLKCDKKILDTYKKISAKINDVNIYMCLKQNTEILQFLTKSESEIIIGILYLPSLLKAIPNIFSGKETQANSLYKNEISKKYGKGKIGTVLNSENSTIWEDKQTILSVGDFGVTVLIEKKHFKFLNKNVTYEEINKIFEGLEDKTYTINTSKNKKNLDKIEKIIQKTEKIIPITLKEIEQIQNHIKNCWKTPYGINDFRDIITLKISLNRDMKVRSVIIEDKEKYSTNKKYRALADSARRAVVNCSQLPIEKKFYHSLKSFIIDFNAF